MCAAEERKRHEQKLDLVQEPDVRKYAKTTLGPDCGRHEFGWHGLFRTGLNIVDAAASRSSDGSLETDGEMNKEQLAANLERIHRELSAHAFARSGPWGLSLYSRPCLIATIGLFLGAGAFAGCLALFRALT